MLQRTIRNFTFRRHYWRHVGIGELSELYASIMLRNLAMNLIGIFVPIYLHKLGYSLPTIFWFFVVFFAIRLFSDLIAAAVIARYGPKHAFALSAVLLIAHLMLLLSLPDLNWPLALVALPWAFSMSFYLIGLHVDFSKVKHKNHGGKELGFSIIFERLGHFMGPLIGGIIASVFDARYTIVIAIIILLASLIPLFLSPEPVKARQTLRFKGLPWRKNIRNYIAFSAYNFESTASIMLWPLLIGVTVFTEGTYAKLGILISASTILTFFAIHYVGKLIDNRKSKSLMRGSVAVNAGIHMLRPFALSSVGVTAVSLSNDPVTVGYRMPVMKSFYDATDHVPGQRIAFIASFEVVNSAAKLLLWLLLWLAALNFNSVDAMQWIYVLVGLASLLILRMNFKGL